MRQIDLIDQATAQTTLSLFNDFKRLFGQVELGAS